MDTEPRYTIGVVARRTGLSAHVIRAWERRHEVVAPLRTDGGTRLYSDADVLRLRLLRRATDSGMPIGRVRDLTLDELVALTAEDTDEDGLESSVADRSRALVPAILAAVEAMDTARLQGALRQASALLGAEPFIERVAIPVLRRVGELWEMATLCPAQEHIFSVQVRRELTFLLDSLGAHEGPGLVAGTLSGELHELGALAASVMAAAEGWRVTYPGPDLPPGEIATTARLRRADVVLVSSIAQVSKRVLIGQVRKLVAALPDGVTLIVGGAGASPYAEALKAVGATYLPDLQALTTTLSTLGRSAAQNRPRKLGAA